LVEGISKVSARHIAIGGALKFVWVMDNMMKYKNPSADELLAEGIILFI
jgi:hypothetical protein